MLTLLVVCGTVESVVNENLPDQFRCRISVQSDIPLDLYLARERVPQLSLAPGTRIVALARLGGFYDKPHPVWLCQEIHVISSKEDTRRLVQELRQSAALPE